jgi:5-methylcytosine-specific restriction enzyme A
MQLVEHPLCVMCEMLGKLVPASVVDHVVPHKGDLERFFNGPFQSLCKHHHDSAKQREERSGVMVGSDVKGNPIDPNHHWNKM